MRPGVGNNPRTPQAADGMRIDPPPSDPMPSGVTPAAIFAPVPPLDAPGQAGRRPQAAPPFRGLQSSSP